MRKFLITLCVLLGSTIFLPADAQPDPLASCAQCHALTLSEIPEDKITHRMERKAPDLHYAGRKFNQDWLVHWLQEPVRIRPGGVFFGRHVETGPDGQDVIASDSLLEHPSFNEKEAGDIAAALMSKSEVDAGLVPEGAYAGKGNVRFGKMAFVKLRGCIACHENEPGKGGVSGPELYTSSQRLRPDFIAAMIARPQEIEPRSWMPHLEMSDRDVQNLTSYLMSLDPGEEQ